MESANDRAASAVEFLKKKFKNRSFSEQDAEKYMHFTVIRLLEEEGYLRKSSAGKYQIVSSIAVPA